MSRSRTSPSGKVNLDDANTYGYQYNANFVVLAAGGTIICTVNLLRVRPGNRLLIDFSTELTETAAGNSAGLLRFLANGVQIGPNRNCGVINGDQRMFHMHDLHTIGAAPVDPYVFTVEGFNLGAGTLEARASVLSAFYL